MVVGVAALELFLLEQPNSLKGKRSVLRRLKERLTSRFNLSVAEVGDNDLWQKASIGLACVAPDQLQAERVLQNALQNLERDNPVEIVSQQLEYHHY